MSKSPEELPANMSLQETINHISAVSVPVVGGTIWVLFGSQTPFLAGVGVAIATLILTHTVDSGGEGRSVSCPSSRERLH